ncbi:PREDICTED: uncharacterized protein LOC108568731 [Nicrophorus vespilloides]|uniref:Uncharacterized protein LOC108568731 n=1 Tax=Nicrophorus vespilloides TaxID=110193 RepID=A0ABM1NF60_NICVS|nr:PREDICTED: uncharacterized protein LOC108568731 [Nicrophorus vespilloides]
MNNEIFLFDDIPNCAGGEAPLITKSEVQPRIIFYENPSVNSNSSSEEEQAPPPSPAGAQGSSTESMPNSTPTVTVDATGSSDSRPCSNATTAEAHDGELTIGPIHTIPFRCFQKACVVKIVCASILIILVGIAVSVWAVLR